MVVELESFKVVEDEEGEISAEMIPRCVERLHLNSRMKNVLFAYYLFHCPISMLIYSSSFARPATHPAGEPYHHSAFCNLLPRIPLDSREGV